jgi:hypothetical protein
MRSSCKLGMFWKFTLIEFFAKVLQYGVEEI